jgi:hypothetical protein
MKKLLALKLFGLVAILTVALVFISVDFMEGQVQTQDKPPNPPGQDKPDKPQTEWIEFTGDLVGAQAVDGCCPNAGPYPEYTMTLTKPVGHINAGTYYGYLFINGYGAGRKTDRQYMVQFGTGDCVVAMKIIGGEIDFDKRTRVLTVEFTDVLVEDWCTGQPLTELTFTLVRQPI